MKHTKGNWKVEDETALSYLYVRTDNPTDERQRGLVAMVDSQGNSAQQEFKANAKLIAAAPKMLEGLHEAVSTIETLMREHNDENPSFKMSLAQIKKAIKATE